MKAFIINKPAGELKLDNLPVPAPGNNEVLIKHTAIGLNFFDVNFRRGEYKLNQLPAILGLEACGHIEAVGSGVTDYKAGERVAYATGGIGAFTEKRVINQRFLTSPPASLSDVQIAGSLLKGMMAHTLLFRVYLAAKARRVLVHSAAGGVGQFLCQWGKKIGLEIIGTVGSDQKIATARANGCDHVINYKSQNLISEIEKITNSEGVGMVFDGIGKDTLSNSLACLWPMGICVSFGEASGPVPPFDLNYLLANSLYITRPTLTLYKANRIELALSANEVFSKLEQGILKPTITSYKFSQLPEALKKLEEGGTTGSLVVTI